MKCYAKRNIHADILYIYICSLLYITIGISYFMYTESVCISYYLFTQLVTLTIGIV